MAGNYSRLDSARMLDNDSVRFESSYGPNEEFSADSENIAATSPRPSCEKFRTTRKFKVVCLAMLILIAIIAVPAVFIHKTPTEEEIRRQEVYNLCVDLIDKAHEGKTSSACLNLNNTSRLETVTKKAYHRNSSVHEIVNFASHLSYCSHKLTVYSVLLTEMRINVSILSTPDKLLILDDIQTCNHVNDFEKHQFDSIISEIFLEWTDAIRNGSTKEILSWKDRISMIDYLPYFVRESFSNNLTNFKNVLNFISELYGYDDSLFREGCATLLSEMAKGGWLYSYETIQLAFKIKNMTDISIHLNVSEEEQLELDILIKSLPDSIVGLMWEGDNCTIQNVRYKEYLYVAAQPFDNETHYVWSWVPGFVDEDCFWKIEVKDNGDYFTLKSIRHDMYMFASSTSKDASRRWAHAWVNEEPDERGFWKLKPVDGNKFAMLHISDSEYLYADWDIMSHGDPPNRRGVFTKMSGASEDLLKKEFQWSIVCDGIQDSADRLKEDSSDPL